MYPKQSIALLFSFILLSCQTDPGSAETRNLSSGDNVSLRRTIIFPDLQSHIIIQNGKIIADSDLYAYKTSCLVDNRDLGPKTIQPQSYTVRKVTYNEEMFSDGGAIIRYFIEIYLTANDQQHNLILTCQTLDDTMQYHIFPVTEIEQTTGDYFSF